MESNVIAAPLKGEQKIWEMYLKNNDVLGHRFYRKTSDFRRRVEFYSNTCSVRLIIREESLPNEAEFLSDMEEAFHHLAHGRTLLNFSDELCRKHPELIIAQLSDAIGRAI
jgi:hypothetical protein